jgi:hypothetical protein
MAPAITREPPASFLSPPRRQDRRGRYPRRASRWTSWPQLTSLRSPACPRSNSVATKVSRRVLAPGYSCAYQFNSRGRRPPLPPEVDPRWCSNVCSPTASRTRPPKTAPPPAKSEERARFVLRTRGNCGRTRSHRPPKARRYMTAVREIERDRTREKFRHHPGLSQARRHSHRL